MIARTSVVIISGMLASLRGPRTGLWDVRPASPQLLTTLAARPDPAVAATRRGRRRRTVSPPRAELHKLPYTAGMEKTRCAWPGPSAPPPRAAALHTWWPGGRPDPEGAHEG